LYFGNKLIIKKELNLYPRIKELVESGKVSKFFKSTDFPFLERSKPFLPKHCVGNGKYSEYFERVSRGVYKLK
jgi:hypothetical protein